MSQTCTCIVSSARVSFFDLKLTPTVPTREGKNWSIVQRIMSDDLPTPLSPSMRIFHLRMFCVSAPMVYRGVDDLCSTRSRFSVAAARRSSSSSRSFSFGRVNVASSRPCARGSGGGGGENEMQLRV